MINRD